MDEVDFVVRSEHHPPIGYWSVLDVRVNGARLQELVTSALEAQSTHGDTVVPGADYMGLDPSAASAGHFLGGYPVTHIHPGTAGPRPRASPVHMRRAGMRQRECRTPR